MVKVNLFTDSIIIESVMDQDLDEAIIKVLNTEEKNNKNVLKSNKGGFQTEDIYDEKICETLLGESAKAISKNYNVKTSYGLKNLWINKNLKNNYNTPHTHPKSQFSGIYYVDVKENGGDLVFFRNDISNSMLNLNNIITSSDFHNVYCIKPLKHQLILFSSNLQHMVTPHSDEGARISVSFNIGLFTNNG